MILALPALILRWLVRRGLLALLGLLARRGRKARKAFKGLLVCPGPRATRAIPVLPARLGLRAPRGLLALLAIRVLSALRAIPVRLALRAILVRRVLASLFWGP